MHSGWPQIVRACGECSGASYAKPTGLGACYAKVPVAARMMPGCESPDPRIACRRGSRRRPAESLAGWIPNRADRLATVRATTGMRRAVRRRNGLGDKGPAEGRAFGGSGGPGFRRNPPCLATRIVLTSADLKLPVMSVSLGASKTPGQSVGPEGRFPRQSREKSLRKSGQNVTNPSRRSTC